MRNQLVANDGNPRYSDPNDKRVIFASPLVDIATNMDLVRETAQACAMILHLTNWHIRLLSKSNLLPKVVEVMRGTCGISDDAIRERMIFGVSTGTLRNDVAKAIEVSTPLVSKRIESIHRLQDAGYRTYGMACPSLPQSSYSEFSHRMFVALRAERMEGVWAEVINSRGESFINTHKSLLGAGLGRDATALASVSNDLAQWEVYARDTFIAHAAVFGDKLHFLHYPSPGTLDFWGAQTPKGAVLLGPNGSL